MKQLVLGVALVGTGIIIGALSSNTAQRARTRCRRHSRTVLLAKTGFLSCMTLNPLSTLSSVALLVRPPHSPCPYYTHVHVRYWHGGTILVHRTLVDATGYCYFAESLNHLLLRSVLVFENHKLDVFVHLNKHVV